MRLASLLLCAATLAATPTLAATLRCNGNIIKSGMTAQAVKEKCGEPRQVRAFVTSLKSGDGDLEEIRYEHGEVWLFDEGPMSTLKLVHFHNEAVSAVTASKFRGKTRGEKMDCLGRAKDFTKGEPEDIVGYLCGDPASRYLVAEEFRKQGERNGKPVARQVKSEDWHYAGGDLKVVYRFKDHRLQQVDRKM